MGRYQIALAACMMMLAGCAGQRILETEGAAETTMAHTAAVAQAELNPFEAEFAQPLKITPVRDEIGLPPEPAGKRMDMYGAVPDDLPAAPPIPSEPTELAPDDAGGAAAVASDPCVDFPEPCAVRAAKRARGCCTPKPCCPKKPCCAKKTCCGKKSCGANCGCKKKCACLDRCGNPCGGYAGLAAAVLPGAGVMAEFGINLKRDRIAMWSLDFGLMYQDFYDEIGGGDDRGRGKMNMFRGGLMWRFLPCCRVHPTLRVGIGWMQATGKPEFLDSPTQIDTQGDYVGGYAGIGLEVDLGNRWSTGPEAMYFYGSDFNDNTAQYLTGLWHLTYKF